MPKTVAIEDFLQEWKKYELMTMRNLGLVEPFFRKGLTVLNTDAKGYVQAFDAFTRCLVWRDLHAQGQPSLRFDIFHTLGQYAQCTGKEPCRSKRTANNEWRYGVERVTVRYSESEMLNFMRDALESQLSAPQKLHICKLAPLLGWQHKKYKDAIVTLLPTDEGARLQELPWFTYEVEEQIAFVRDYCPNLTSILENVLPREAWQDKSAILAFALGLKKESVTTPLPEDFSP